MECYLQLLDNYSYYTGGTSESNMESFHTLHFGDNTIIESLRGHYVIGGHLPVCAWLMCYDNVL